MGWNENGMVREWDRLAFAFRLIKELLDVESICTFKQPLDPKCQHIFSYHPHGIIGIGCNRLL